MSGSALLEVTEFYTVKTCNNPPTKYWLISPAEQGRQFVLKWSATASCPQRPYFIWGFQLKFIRSKYCVGPVPYPGRETNDSGETRERVSDSERLSVTLQSPSWLLHSQSTFQTPPTWPEVRGMRWEETPDKLEKQKKTGETGDSPGSGWCPVSGSGRKESLSSCCHWWWACCCCHCSGSFYLDNVVSHAPLLHTIDNPTGRKTCNIASRVINYTVPVFLGRFYYMLTLSIFYL